jgi:hypothetical protein
VRLAVIASVVALLAGLATGAFFMNAHNTATLERERGEWARQREDMANAHVAEITAAREAEQQMRDRYDRAVNEAAVREANHREDSATSRAALDSLRNELARARASLSKSSAAPARDTLDTGYELLAECAAEYRDMAEQAQAHANDVRKLIAAWPRHGD